ncbi:LOG family protein [Nesterenkonia muleiensis]|uniref:LOG family protein n=1 Tax=Nesterenkonia muleiensis TaxID=2282648 RepID=UPI000E715316|nr:hypothetical protein [Nesterenkonia muleiensis]
MTELSRITVFTGGTSGHDLAYQQDARTLGAELGWAGIGLVYGGGKVGLMGQVSDSALEAGGQVVG